MIPRVGDVFLWNGRRCRVEYVADDAALVSYVEGGAERYAIVDLTDLEPIPTNGAIT